MFKRKKKEPIVINKEPLATTTIGIINTKENGPIFAIIGILLFLGCIIALPYINEWINDPSSIIPSTPNTPPSEEEPAVPDDGNDEENEEPGEETSNYPLTADLTIDIEGYTFNNFVLDETAKTLSFTLTNNTGDTNLFADNNYYLEMYTTDSLLLGRIRLTTDVYTAPQNYSYDVTSALNNGTISTIAIVTKEDEDYPPVELSIDENDRAVLTCQKNGEETTYYFNEENRTFKLIQIDNRRSFLSTDPSYSNYLTEYTTLAETYSAINGVTASLNPTTSGFSFMTSIDLNTITTSSYRNFTGEIYYPKDTEARVIHFELTASGYTCE